MGQRWRGQHAHARMAVMAEQSASETAEPRTGVAGAYLLLVIATLSWAGNMIVARALAGLVPPFGLSVMRWTIAFTVVFPFVAREIVVQRAAILRQWRILLLLGLLGLTICNSLGYLGLQWTTAVNAALINSAGPMLTLAAGFLLHRERVHPVQFAGMLISLAGVIIIVLRGDIGSLLHLAINRGDIAILVGVATWSIYTVLLRHCPRELSPLALLAVLFAIGGVTVLPLHLVESALGRPLPETPAALMGYVYVGLFPAVIAFFGWNRGVQVLGANRASLFSHLMPLFSAVLAYGLLGERILGFHLVGGIFIFSGIFLANRRARAAAVLLEK
jgi:drug/metabolite transporter (DMT)-like permease